MNIVKAKSEKEYRKLEALSSSDLRVFSSDRKKFFKTRVLGETVEEEYSRSMLIGHLVHCLLLEPEEFDKRYFTSICTAPPTGKMLDFVETLYKNRDIPKLSDNIRKSYDEVGFTWTLQTVVKKFTEGTGEDYYNQLLEARGKGLEVVCAADLSISEKIISIIKGDRNVGPIFNKSNHREVKIEKFYIDGFELKGMIDDIEVNHEDKEIKISDLKVVYDNQNFYREYYLKKNSYIQAYLYYEATKTWAINQGLKDYLVHPPRFIAVDSGCFFAPVIYELEKEHLDKAYLGFKEGNKYYPGVKEILEEVSWAQENNIWNMTKKQYLCGGRVKLDG